MVLAAVAGAEWREEGRTVIESLSSEQAEITRVIATAGSVLSGILIGALGVVFALYFDRASGSERGQRPATLAPLRATAWILVALLVLGSAVVGTSIWWFSDPSIELYNAVLALFLTQMLAMPLLLSFAVWYWLS